MKKKIKFLLSNFFEVILSIPKTIYFNFKVLPINYAIKLPFIVSYHIKISGINKSCFIVDNKNIKMFSQRIGFGGSNVGVRENKKGFLSIKSGGKIFIRGKIGLSRGIIIECINGEIDFGDNFRSNYSSTIYCKDSSIVFGSDVALGWFVNIRNGDGHYIIRNNEKSQQSKQISIGNHVWICSYAHILKGVKVGDNCVISYRSLMIHGSCKNNVLYGGVPAKIISENINWEE